METEIVRLALYSRVEYWNVSGSYRRIILPAFESGPAVLSRFGNGGGLVR
jgi:hypothetical protein